ncbi:poly [ADP-ribose] polymerase tankyrase-2-like [Schistocerca piceifrons]|uniref:poly [ADP-ribose] polymerase tankyrase-2-like n=1 Tax=Schistocerca piceifrons TaxID=274613 RepID=UPI001F5EA9ED|nr:poly [ADP-ribose] polymerase tankyrase-2-like [Schistocerca piceifrons]
MLASVTKGGTHEAAKYGNLAELFEILQHGMDINSRCENGYTAIHRKAKCGDTSAVNWLLESGANVTVWGDWQQTTLHVAAAYGRQGVVMVLLFHGADKDAWDGCGQTALQIAATCGEAAVVNLLLWLGTDRSAAGYGKMPLELVLACNRRAVLDILSRICPEYHGAVLPFADKASKNIVYCEIHVIELLKYLPPPPSYFSLYWSHFHM